MKLPRVFPSPSSVAGRSPSAVHLRRVLRRIWSLYSIIFLLFSILLSSHYILSSLLFSFILSILFYFPFHILSILFSGLSILFSLFSHSLFPTFLFILFSFYFLLHSIFFLFCFLGSILYYFPFYFLSFTFHSSFFIFFSILFSILRSVLTVLVFIPFVVSFYLLPGLCAASIALVGSPEGPLAWPRLSSARTISCRWTSEGWYRPECEPFPRGRMPRKVSQELKV